MKRQRAQELRAAVDRLPLSTRQAMLEGIDRKPIIVGADGNLGGGVCPMLAASAGSQKEVGKPFARAWDRYAGCRLARRATERELLTLRTMLMASIEAQTQAPVELREGAMLARQAASARKAEPPADLRAVMTRTRRAEPTADARPATAPDAGPVVDLRAAIEDHEATKERNEAALRASEARASVPAERRDTGERDRTDELSGRHGWAWLRPFRRYDDYERALKQLREEAESRLSASDERELAAHN